MPESDFSLREWAGVDTQQNLPPSIIQPEKTQAEFSLKDWAGVSPESAKPPTLGEDLAKRGQKIQELSGTDADLAESKGYLVGGQVAGAAMDVMGHAISAVTPEFVKKGIGAVINAPASVPEAGGEQGLSIADHQAEFNRQMESLKETHPEVYNHIIATGNYAALGTMFIPGKKAAEALTPEALAKTAGAVAGRAEKRLAGQVEKEALDVVKRDPDLMTVSQKQKLEKIEPGVFIKEGNKSVIKTTQFDTDIAKSVEDVVNPRLHPQENIDAIRGKITKTAEETEKVVKKSDQLYSSSELEPYLQRTKKDSEILFAGEKTIERNYDAVIDKFKEIVETKDKTLSGALEARKELDQFIKSKFGNVFDKEAGDLPRANALKDVRMAVNDYIANTLPEGDKFKTLLKEQSNMYRAIDRIITKRDYINSSKFYHLTQIIKRHPWLAAEAAAGMAGGGLMSMGVGGTIVKVLTNPVILGGIAAYGGMLVGKHYITARGLKSGLVNFLRTSERILKPQEKLQIQKIITQLPQETGVVPQVPQKPSMSYGGEI